MKLEGALFFIFGATGDLAKRKLFPAIYSMYKEGQLQENFSVIGIARRPRTQEQFWNDVKNSINEFARHKVTNDDEWNEFVQHFEYYSLDINNLSGFEQLNQIAKEKEAKFQIGGNRLFYLALAPELFGRVSHNLQAGGLLESAGWQRLVIEKPFGYNYESAEELNNEVRKVFEEDQIFRIDHYLGKDMIQNIEVLRFSNAFFEPLWNNKYIANIQITLSETVGVEDRGDYYDQAGAIRDMGQNHMLQIITMMAMEPPSRLDPEDVRDEKVKVLRSLRLYDSPEEVYSHVVRGQYTKGEVLGKDVPAYVDEEKIDESSTTETYFAAKVFVDNFRWAGVPFYIRTGKRLPVKTTEVVVEFKTMPERVYFANKTKLEPNLLVFRVNPMEGIYVKFNLKAPGEEGMLMPMEMDFCQSAQVGPNTPEDYERLLLDALRGDSTYFTRWDEVSLAWKFIDRIVEAWALQSDDLEKYESGSWGPQGATELLSKDGYKWWPINGQR